MLARRNRNKQNHHVGTPVNRQRTCEHSIALAMRAISRFLRAQLMACSTLTQRVPVRGAQGALAVKAAQKHSGVGVIVHQKSLPRCDGVPWNLTNILCLNTACIHGGKGLFVPKALSHRNSIAFPRNLTKWFDISGLVSAYRLKTG